MRWHSATQVAHILSIAPATALGLIEDGELEAVNCARASSVRKRWRISDVMLSAFQERRANKPAPTPDSKRSRRTIAKPTKDYFATSGSCK